MAKNTTTNEDVLGAVQDALDTWAKDNGTDARADLNLGSARHIVVSETSEETED